MTILGLSIYEQIIFVIFGLLSVFGASTLIFCSKSVHVIAGAILSMVSLAVLFGSLNAPFLAAVQVLVYTGAIVMLFVFVLSLSGVDNEAGDNPRPTVSQLLSPKWYKDIVVKKIIDALFCAKKRAEWIFNGFVAVFALAFFALITSAILRSVFPQAVGLSSVNKTGNVKSISQAMYGNMIFTVELTGAVLMIAAVGAVIILSGKKEKSVQLVQKARSEARGGQGKEKELPPLPAPGVFANSNRANVPSLNPNGEPIQESVPLVFKERGQEVNDNDISYKNNSERKNG